MAATNNHQNYGADWGDFVSFTRHMKQKARKLGVDLLLVDTGVSDSSYYFAVARVADCVRISMMALACPMQHPRMVLFLIPSSRMSSTIF